LASDEQLGVIADRAPSYTDSFEVSVEPTAPGLAHLQLHPRYALAMDPTPELIGQLVIGEGGESSAAVHGDLVAYLTEHLDERQIHELALSGPTGAMSTAAMAIEATPGGPTLRMERTMADQEPPTSIASWPTTASSSTSLIRRAQAPVA